MCLMNEFRYKISNSNIDMQNKKRTRSDSPDSLNPTNLHIFTAPGGSANIPSQEKRQRFYVVQTDMTYSDVNSFNYSANIMIIASLLSYLNEN